MTILNIWLKKKTTIAGVKGSSNSHSKSKVQEEEATRKEKEETAQRLAEGARSLARKGGTRSCQKRERRNCQKGAGTRTEKERRSYQRKYCRVGKINSSRISKSIAACTKPRRGDRRTNK